MPKITEKVYICRVSSVLNKDVKSFGKQFLLDGRHDTCWNSEKGTPQWIYLEFKEDLNFSTLQIQFQGGFAGRTSKLKIKTSEGQDVTEDIYPEDNNSLQTLNLSRTYVAKAVTLVFDDSSDFFGRLVIYFIDLV